MYIGTETQSQLLRNSSLICSGFLMGCAESQVTLPASVVYTVDTVCAAESAVDRTLFGFGLVGYLAAIESWQPSAKCLRTSLAAIVAYEGLQDAHANQSLPLYPQSENGYECAARYATTHIAPLDYAVESLTYRALVALAPHVAATRQNEFSCASDPRPLIAGLFMECGIHTI